MDDRALESCRADDDPVELIGSAAEWQQWWTKAAGRDALAAEASRSGFVLSTARLAELGVTRSTARWATSCGRWTQVGRGIVAPIDLRVALSDAGGEHVLARRQHALAGAAATLRRPADAVSGRTAAIMHGLPTMAVPLIPELNARDETGMGPRSTVWLRAGTLDKWQMTSWFGVDLADVARTVVDLARRDRRDGIMAADAALRERLTNVDEINRAIDLAKQWPGICQARELLSLADPRAESPLESLARLAIHDAGLPAPEPQVWLGRDRVDLYWAAYRLVLEADGRVKYSSDERWEEKKREQRLRRLGNHVERVTWRDVTTGWPQTRRILEAALR